MYVSRLLLAAMTAQTLVEAEVLTPQKLEKDITEPRLRSILVDLDRIAKDNGGNRAFGYPGFNASMHYVLNHMQQRWGEHYTTTLQKFTHLFSTTRKIELTGPDGKVPTKAWLYNVATPLPNGITAELIDTPVDDERGSMCHEDMWKKINVKDKIVLMKRGTCPNYQKVKLAKRYGAIATVIYNPEPASAIPPITLGGENQGLIVPVAPTTFEVAEKWKKRLAAGEKVEVNIIIDCSTEDRPSWNIISETKTGDPNKVVMLGAHLDSVPDGPGINDDGTGVSALLTLAASLTKYTGFKNKVRFAWWAVEEPGLIGSLYYTSKLTQKGADSIKFYYNYDMIGSPSPAFDIYANNDKHKYGGKHLFNYLHQENKAPRYIPFVSDSDYVGFLKLGIPCSGIVTGAGKPWDPNYHTNKDDLSNVNMPAFLVNTKAAARGLAELALSLDGVPPRENRSINPRSKAEIIKRFKEWAEISSEAQKKHSCGDHDSRTI